MKKLLTSLVAAGVLAGTATTASALVTPVLPDFTVSASQYGGPATPFVADELNGAYIEDFVVTGANTFATVAYWQITSFSRSDGQVVMLPAATGLNTAYGMYAIFSATGTFSVVGDNVTFTANAGAFSLYVDDDLNTVVDETSNLLLIDPVTGAGFSSGLASLADDDLILTGGLSFGEGNGKTSGLANGNFGIDFKPVTLTTPDGENFFIAPRPFYLQVEVDGQFRSFNPTVGSEFRLSGTADANFAPEPASVGLLGLALLGGGLASRRARKQAV